MHKVKLLIRPQNKQLFQKFDTNCIIKLRFLGVRSNPIAMEFVMLRSLWLQSLRRAEICSIKTIYSFPSILLKVSLKIAREINFLYIYREYVFVHL